MRLLRVIENFDPSFKTKLEGILIKAAPRLYEAENEFIPHILMGVPLKTMMFDECLKEIIKAMEAVPGLVVERQQLDFDGNEIDSSSSQVFSWSSQEIAQDRFSYLEAVNLKR